MFDFLRDILCISQRAGSVDLIFLTVVMFPLQQQGLPNLAYWRASKPGLQPHDPQALHWLDTSLPGMLPTAIKTLCYGPLALAYCHSPRHVADCCFTHRVVRLDSSS